MLPPLAAAALELKRTRPTLVPVVAAAPALRDAWLPREAAAAGVRRVRGRTHAVQAFARACAVSSGTATLETALFGTPLTVVYRTGRLNYAIARRVVKLTRIGLPNIVANTDVAPELIQDALTPASLAASLAAPLDDDAAHARIVEALAAVRRNLGAPGASRRAAERVWAMAG